MLVSYKQIDGNLRRTAQKGYISLLDHYQLEALALKYFGVKDEDGEIIGYTCPYSGNLITDFSDIVLEHIISVSSKGGTVLFNCIPTSLEVNKTSEKGAKPLIDWWTNSKYWDEEAPLRLEKLVNYMLEAYENVFKEYTVEEVENSYLDIELYEEERETTADLEISSKKEQQIQQSNNQVQTYLGTILNFIETLEKHNINTIEIRNKLKQLEDNHIFEDIEKYQLFQNIIQQLIISKIGDDNRSYLTYTLNIDKKKLMDSINSNNPEYIFNEINNRLTYIENILKQNNLSIIDYFKSVGEITDIDVIYNSIDKITKKEQDMFLENIKLGIDSKIDIFINMLNKGNSKIFDRFSNEKFEGYNIIIGQFWKQNKEIIISRLFNELKDNPHYDRARIVADEQLFKNDLSKKIDVFIKMLNNGNSIILNGKKNNDTFEGYPNIKIGFFWQSNDNKKLIINKLFEELKDNIEYDIARDVILKHLNVSDINEYYYQEQKRKEYLLNLSEDEIQFRNNMSKKIEVFIEMLNKGNTDIFKNTKICFEGYENTPIAQFWQSRKEKIIKKLFVDLKDNIEYNTAKNLILKKLKVNTIEEYYQQKKEKEQSINALSDKEIEFRSNLSQRIDVFINMLNKGNDKILDGKNTDFFEGYENTPVGFFWQSNNNKEIIIKKLFEELKYNSKYEVARKIILNKFMVKNIEEYYEKEREKQKFKNNLSSEEVEFQNNLFKKIDLFIDMLNKGNSNILKERNDIYFEGYNNTPIGQFWRTHKEIVIQKLFEDLKNDSKYDTARRIVDINEMTINVEMQIPIFIDMLNKGNSEILKARNKETLEGYPNIKLAHFWSNHKEIVIQKLFEDLKNDSKYDTARRIVDINEMTINVEKQIPIFINMLNKGNRKILKYGNKETLDGYPNIKLAKFWSAYKERIVQKVFIELKDKPEYDTARKIINIHEMTINVEKQIPIFLIMLNKGNNRILKQKNKETLEGYPNIKLSYFWNDHKQRIIQKLFYDLKDNQEYTIARQTVLIYLKVSTIEEYQEKLKKQQELNELKKMKKELEVIEDTIELESNEHRKRA